MNPPASPPSPDLIEAAQPCLSPFGGIGRGKKPMILGLVGSLDTPTTARVAVSIFTL